MPIPVGKNAMPRLELALDSKLDSVDTAESCVRWFAEQLGYSEEQQAEVSLAVREAVANAIFHGNKGDPQKTVMLRAAWERTRLRISVCDEGNGIDLSSLPNPLDPSRLFEGSGRGIRFINCLMDEVIFQNKTPGTEVIMIKDLRNAVKEENRQ